LEIKEESFDLDERNDSCTLNPGFAPVQTDADSD
jgi:hypothetical protein